MPTASDYTTTTDQAVPSTTAASAVSWGAILAGAAAAAALSLILLILGMGLGLSSISPWAQRGADASTLGVATILWITLTSLAASGLGGYLAGRLRTRWLSTHVDEVYFRDTAHGLLTWAVATLATAALLTSSITSIVGTGVQAGASVIGGAAQTAGMAAVAASAGEDNGAMDYFVDTLLRPAGTAASTDTLAPATGAALDAAGNPLVQPAARPARGMRGGRTPRAEITRIFANGLRTGGLPPDDLRYLSERLAERSGLTPAEAETRVRDTYARLVKTTEDARIAAREMADKARKASAYTALWLFISLLGGAFVASWLATWGGRQRDL